MGYKLLIMLFLVSLNLISQTDGMSYQAIILNPEGVGTELPGENDYNGVFKSKSISLRFTVTNHTNSIEYAEKHFTKTDEFGMVNVVIGAGIPEIGEYTDIFWDGEKKTLKVEISFGGNYEELSIQELLFTPYAFHREIIATGDLSIEGNTLFAGNLVVDGTTDLNNSLSVNDGFSTNLTGTLTVGGETTLNENLVVDGTTDLNNSLSVNNDSPTSLTGTLTVGGGVTLNDNLVVNGITDLKNSLSVNNGSPTSLTGTLTVGGDVTLNESLVVDGTTGLNNSLSVNNGSPTNLTGTLTVGEDVTLNDNLVVDGTTDLNNSLSVNNGSPTSLTGTLEVTESTTLKDRLDVNGQTTIKAVLSGGDENYNNYPFRVEGGSNGVAIKIDSETPDSNNNFITFFDKLDNPIGRIEGQTATDVRNEPDFIYDQSILVAEQAKAIANQALAAIPVTSGGVVVTVGVCGGCIAAAAADLVLATANLAAFNVFAFENLGVSYQSGSADYAEWLKRQNPEEIIKPSDIVGIRGGMISKNTTNANQFLVISTKPVVSGNMPSVDQKKLYNQVAFLGQVPTKVRGKVNVGDYIIPSGKNDGVGVAVSPEEISPKQYKLIVGIAWSPILFDIDSYSLINMAIGLKSNDLAVLVEKQEERISNLEYNYEVLNQRMTAFESGKLIEPILSSDKVVHKDMTISKNKDTVKMPMELTDKILNDAITYLQEEYMRIGVDINKHIGLSKLLNDKDYQKEIFNKTKKRYKEMYNKYY
ncbi:autotransporter outer membrane beta-barrel domain-containing protein [Aquimarina sediminis]|uniref:hypothetical protein n=1 Tax=Aquimarina sediminis TaxID=2070536 RepID=UPI000CA029DC|nr:hypothetical protein [Aquimarina sediminis]